MTVSVTPLTGQRSSAEARRERIIEAAAHLLEQGGREALSMRAVSAAADVQSPTIYRLFGDKRGLLDALAIHGLRTHYATHAALDPTEDPVEDLRRGWNQHIEFGLANPALYGLIYGEPRQGGAPPAAVDAATALSSVMHRIAQTGRLRVSEDRAAQLFFAAGCGTVLTLLAVAEEHRDLGLVEDARDALLSAVLTDGPAVSARDPAAAAAATLRAVLADTDTFSAHEKGLLGHWLERIEVASGT